MEINPSVFRMYDIRGIVGKDLTEEVLETLGKAFGTYIKQRLGKDKVTLALGSDHRESGNQFRKAFAKGAMSTGCDIVDVGVVPTPLLYYSIIKLDADGGAQITGSHNPPEYNGVKMCVGWPAIYGEGVKEVGRIAKSGEFDKGKGNFSEKRMDDAYLKELKGKFDLKRKLKVVVDAGNGMGSEIGPDFFRELGCEVIELYCELDGSFPNHLPDPLKPGMMKELSGKVKEVDADIGIAFDGDADRVGVVDRNGNLIACDLILLLCARDFLERNPGEKVVFDTKVSMAVINGIKKVGGVPVIWKTGHSLIKAKMIKDNIKLGGELSGHMFFREDYYGIDDGFYSAGKILELVSNKGKGVSEMLADVEKYVNTPEIDIACDSDEDKFNAIEAVVGKFKEKYETITVDGIRVVFDDGWGLIRASNTRPSLTMRVEAKTNEGVERIKKELFAGLDGLKGVNV